MRTVSVRLADLEKAIIPIGFVGENLHTQVRIDCKKAYEDYPNAAVSLTVNPPKGDKYPAVVVRDGDIVVWDITNSDLIYNGTGEFQLSFTVDDVVAKSFKGRVKILDSIVANGEVPDPIDDFLTRAGAALTAIPETIDAALQEAKDSGEFDGAPGADGQDGHSPVVTASKVGKVTTVSVDGSAIATINDGNDGQDGSDGQPGADGFSPTASVSKSGKVSTFTVTDKNGTTTVQINDGQDGSGQNIIDDTAGSGDTDKVWSADKTATENSSLLNAITNSATEEDLLRSEMPGTSTTVTTDSDGNPTSIVHTANSATVRTDTFVWGTGTVTETRTLANGRYITITTNLETLAQTISAVQEVA